MHNEDRGTPQENTHSYLTDSKQMCQEITCLVVTKKQKVRQVKSPCVSKTK